MPLISKAILEIDQYNLHEGRRLHFYPKGEVIPVIQPGVWQIEHGWVQLSMLWPNGEEVLLGWVGSSGFFGLWLFQSLKGLQGSQPQLHISYQAISDVYLRWFSMTEIEASPRLSQTMLLQLVRRQQQTETLLAIAGLRRVEDRLHRLLLLLQQEVGQPVPEGIRLGIRLTHQTLANAIGTTRVTVTRLLSQMQHQGWMTLDRDRHIILKDNCFATLCEW
jgi:CRP-like cAMP-binding protein